MSKSTVVASGDPPSLSHGQGPASL